MGWTIRFQVVRDRPLAAVELTALRSHVRRFRTTERSKGYGFAVAPKGAAAGVIAMGGGKLARSADPGEDEDAARLYAALTELRTLIVDSKIEISDDFHLVGWNGDRVDLVRDPDQELTPAPGDLTDWIQIPAPRAPRKAAKAAATPLDDLQLPPDLVAAFTEILTGSTPTLPDYTDDDARAAAAAVLSAITRAHKPKERDRALCDALEALARVLPPRAVVLAGLTSPRPIGDAEASTIGEALARLPDLVDVRDRIVELWLGPPPARDPHGLWDRLSHYVLRPAMRDSVVVARLGDDLDQANFDDRALQRRHFQTRTCLARVRDGVIRLIRRRRNDRERPRTYMGPLLVESIAEQGFSEAVPTLLLELSRSDSDRDAILVSLARFDDPRVLPILERALATDQYTRQIATALLQVASVRATELLEQLLTHDDPLVQIRAAQGLVARRGAQAVPLLVAAIAHARAAGIWRYEYPPGGWNSEQLRCPEDGLKAPWILRNTWPALGTVNLDVSDPEVEPSSATARMRSANPDVRRDAIELAHEAALAARDATSILRLVYAERLHRALCDRAGVPYTTPSGSCSRVNITTYWSETGWRKMAKIPFDPMYKYDSVTWTWLDQHAAEAAPQVIPAELSDVPSLDAAIAAAAATPDRRLRFTAEELAMWDEDERRIAG